MSVFTVAICCLTTFNLPWFMDLTFQVPMQYCSLQHQILLLSPVTSTTGCCFCIGSISSFFLELFLHWSHWHWRDCEEIPHIQGQRRSHRDSRRGKSCLESSPYLPETLTGLKHTSCTRGPRDPTDTEPDLSLSVSCGGMGQHGLSLSVLCGGKGQHGLSLSALCGGKGQHGLLQG